MELSALSPLARSFLRHLRAENRSETTVNTYMVGVGQAEAFLRARGKGLVDASRADLESFLGELLTQRAPGTVATYFKALRILYGWLEEEDEIPSNPMARMKPPIVPDQPVPVIPEDALRRLLHNCAGKGFESRRDAAIIMLLLDTGLRREALAAYSSTTWTPTIRSSGSSTRAGSSARCRSGSGPPKPSTATSACGLATRTQRSRGCGLASRAG
jgi:site-specific recombinase XerD